MLRVQEKEVKLQLNGAHQFVFCADGVTVDVNVFNESTRTQLRDMAWKLV